MMVIRSTELKANSAKIINKKKKMSLILLKTKALKAAFNVAFLVTQKLIKTNDVNPISSHPKNSKIVLADETKKTMLRINVFRNKIRRSTSGS